MVLSLKTLGTWRTTCVGKVKMSNSHGIYDTFYTRKCVCCLEIIGTDDDKAIREQIEKNEKNCIWCGYDFPRDKENIIIVDEEEELREIARLLNRDSSNYLYHKKAREYEEKLSKKYKEPKVEKPFDELKPKYVDINGNPRDRINDAIPYEEIQRDSVQHKMLKCIKNNPGCNGSFVRLHAKPSNKTQKYVLENSPLSRLYASKLVDCKSEFMGFNKMKDYSPFSELEKIPRFSRKYILTERGEGIIKIFETTNRKMVFV